MEFELLISKLGIKQSLEKNPERKICLILPKNLWNIIENYNEYSLEKTLRGHTPHVVWYICITPNGKQIISCGSGGTIKIWDLETGKCEKTLRGHTGGIYSVCVTPNKRSDFDRKGNGKRIISRGDDKTIKIWDLETGKCEKTLGISGISISPANCVTSNEKRIISGSCDGTIRIWDSETGKCEKTLKGHTGSIHSVCVTPNKKQIISGSEDRTIKIWDLKSGKCEKTLVERTGSLRSVFVILNEKQIISGSHDKIIRICDLEIKENSGEFNLPVKTLEGHTGTVWSICVTPNERSDSNREENGKQIISGSDDKTIKIWDLKTGKLIQTLEEHTNTVWCVCIHPNKKQIISGGQDKTIRIWTNRIFNN